MGVLIVTSFLYLDTFPSRASALRKRLRVRGCNCFISWRFSNNVANALQKDLIFLI